ncbi:hypothetical protein C8R45DRAFT_623865 [Mycena sanguinolenta]|nr:hypothetical protein C8R45DRAFT_623865 [Mycena sanguinolenta]
MSLPIQLLGPTPNKLNNDPSVQKFTHAPPYIPGPYACSTLPESLPYLPSLSCLCVQKLAQVAPEQASSLIDVRLNNRLPASEEAYDLLRALIPSLSLPEFEWASVDPRLWATVVQIYDNLPLFFHSYSIPLGDTYLPLLQRVKSTPQFSLVTILELPGCRELSDTTIVNFKHLHTLCALDASATALSAHGLKILSGTVHWSDEDQTRKGPSGLRILRLRNCRAIDDKILPHLSQFLLLFILDLRGTKCNAKTFFPAFHPAPESKHPLYHPTPLRACIADLRLDSELFSSPNVFNFYINTLHHPPSTERPTQRTHAENDVVTFNPGSSNFVVGSSTEPPKALKRGVRGLVLNHGPNHRIPDHSAPALRPRPPEISDFFLYNGIAEQEISAHVAKQEVISFYRPTRLQLRNSSRGYSYLVEASFPPSAKDAKLMLYRAPVPWTALTATVPKVPIPKPNGLPDVVTGLSKRKKAEMADFLEQLGEKRQKIRERAATAEPSTSGPETMPLSRNPFRRKASTRNPVAEASSSAAPKQLKAISSIVVPPLPVSVTTDKRPKGGATLTETPSSRLEGKDPKHDRDKNDPKVHAFDWNRWGRK